MSKEDQRIHPYPIRLTKELREKLETAAKAAGRSLNAEMMRRIEASFDSPTVSWRKVIDPAVCAVLEHEASTWNMTFEEALSRKLQEHCDSLLQGLFLEDLSTEAIARNITSGQVLDERLVKANKKRQESPLTPQPSYPLLYLDNINNNKYAKADLRKILKRSANAQNAERIAIETSFVRQIVHQELAKAGITLPPDDESEKETGEGEA